MTTFLNTYKHFTYLKPELKNFLEAHNVGVRKGILNLVDLESKNLNTDQRWLGFLRANMSGEYDVIECSTNKINLVLAFCQTPPKVLICHMNQENINEIELPNNKIKFFIIVGQIGKIHLASETDLTIIYHARSKGRTPGIYFEGEFFSSDLIDYRDSYNIMNNERLLEELGQRYRPEGGSLKKYPNPIIRAFGEEDEFSEKDKEEYLIMYNNLSGKLRHYLSLNGSESNNVVIDMTIYKDSNKRPFDKYIIVHGRWKKTTSRMPIVIDERKTTETSEPKRTIVIFADMTEKEIKEIVWIDGFYGIDSILTGTNEIFTGPHRKYLYDGQTFGEQLLGTSNPMILSYVDNYFDTVCLKYPNDLFDTYITDYGTIYQTQSKTGRVLTISREIREIVQENIDILRYESHVDSKKRFVLIQRSEALKKNHTPSIPYLSERSAVNAKLLSDYRLKCAVDKNENNDLDLPRRLFKIDPRKKYLFKDFSYIVVEVPKNCECIIHNCKIVVAKGEGRVYISGNTHTLISVEGVEIILDNVSPVDFDPDLFLFVDNGTVFDSITKFHNDSSLDIDEIFTMNTVDIPSSIISDRDLESLRNDVKEAMEHYGKLLKDFNSGVKIDEDPQELLNVINEDRKNIEEQEELRKQYNIYEDVNASMYDATNFIGFKRSVIKFMYCLRFPTNHKTSRIQNLINIHENARKLGR
jgi:hypothetical protein